MSACPLTRRELQAVEDLATGQTIQQIADERSVSLQTVKRHLTGAYRRLGVNNRSQAVLACQQRQWIASPAADAPDVWVQRLAVATDQLCALIREGNKPTQSQSRYLYAVDDLLSAQTDGEQIMARRGMEVALETVLNDGHVAPRRTLKRDLVEMIAGFIAGSR